MAGPSFAEGSYPDHNITMVHAFGAGSRTENTVRVLADRLSIRLGHTVVVESRPGANTAIGLAYASRQPADGYTMVMVSLDMLAINPNLYPNITYSVGDFDPLTLIGMLPLFGLAPGKSTIAVHRMNHGLKTLSRLNYFSSLLRDCLRIPIEGVLDEVGM